MPSSQGEKNAQKKKNDQKQWKTEVTAMKEQDIMAEWAQGYVGLPDWDRRVGRWRPLRTLIDPGKKGFVKEEGVLVLNAAQWDLYFYQDDSFNHDILCERLMRHPFTNNCSFEPLKQKGQWTNWRRS